MPEWFGASQVPIQVLSKYDLLRLGSLGIWIATVKKEFYFHTSGKLSFFYFSKMIHFQTVLDQGFLNKIFILKILLFHIENLLMFSRDK